MRKWDLMPNNPEAQRMFQEILEEARDVCGFDVGQNTQLMIEAYPMTGESTPPSASHSVSQRIK